MTRLGNAYYVYDTLIAESLPLDNTKSFYVFGIPEISYIAGLVHLPGTDLSPPTSLLVGCNTLMGKVIPENTTEDDIASMASSSLFLIKKSNKHLLAYDASGNTTKLTRSSSLPPLHYLRVAADSEHLENIDNTAWLKLSNKDIVVMNDDDDSSSNPSWKVKDLFKQSSSWEEEDDLKLESVYSPHLNGPVLDIKLMLPWSRNTNTAATAPVLRTKCKKKNTVTTITALACIPSSSVITKNGILKSLLKTLISIRDHDEYCYIPQLGLPMLSTSKKILHLNNTTYPIFRYGMTFTTNAKLPLTNVHPSHDRSPVANGKMYLVQGPYQYYHYRIEGSIDDKGWGCAYRTLQTIASWLILNNYTKKPVPSISEIQSTLVAMGDKPSSFVNSKDWIGSVEVGYVLNERYGVTCKGQYITDSQCLGTKEGVKVLVDHFKNHGTPVMMGGGALSLGILGVDVNGEKEDDVAFLILDPHYVCGKKEDRGAVGVLLDAIQNRKVAMEGYKATPCGWRRASTFSKTSFYNLCMPQRPTMTSNDK